VLGASADRRSAARASFVVSIKPGLLGMMLAYDLKVARI
jgi:hypothetical protein